MSKCVTISLSTSTSHCNLLIRFEKEKLTHDITKCYTPWLNFSIVIRSSSHSGYHLAQKSSANSLSLYLSRIVSSCYIVDNFISLLLVFAWAGIMCWPFGTEVGSISIFSNCISFFFSFKPFDWAISSYTYLSRAAISASFSIVCPSALFSSTWYLSFPLCLYIFKIKYFKKLLASYQFV